LLDLEEYFGKPAPEHPDLEKAALVARLRARSARIGLTAESDAELVARLLALFVRWSAARLAHSREVAGWSSFRLPAPMNYAELVPTLRPQAPALPELRVLSPAHLRRRDGFGLTDPRMNDREVMGEVHYCIYCHDRDKDSCSKGLREKTPQAG